MFATLLRELDRVERLERVRFTSPHPKDFKADSVAAMAECRVVCEHIHLPVQAGSDRVLKLMKRAYTKKRSLEKVDMVRAAIPDVAITTDIIVGFPGETEEDFQDTLDLVATARYDDAFTFQYSARPMTAAASMDGHLPKEVVQERYERLHVLQERICLERNERLVGSEQEVLVEGPSKKDPSKLTGRTRGNKLLHFDGVEANEGSLVRTRVVSAHPHHLEGIALGSVRPSAPQRTRFTLPLVSSGAACSSCG
jgi:tRNA-2-methylthio-N6-dimethylallyladenosine synthase